MNFKVINLLAAVACLASLVVVSIQTQQPVSNGNSGSISGQVTVDGKPKAGLMIELLATDTNGARDSAWQGEPIRFRATCRDFATPDRTY